MQLLLLSLLSVVLLAGCFEDVSNSTENISVGQVDTESTTTGGVTDTDYGPLNQIVERSDFGALVRVKGTPEVILSNDDHPVPYTVVTFEVLKKGFGEFNNSYGDNTFNVKYVEGCWPDGRCVAASHNPKGFQDGDQAVVFVKQSDPPAPCGFTECYNGVFHINHKGQLIAPNETIVAFDNKGRTRFIRENSDSSAFKGLADQNHVDTFMQRISSIADKASEHAKGMRTTIESHIKGQPLLGSPSLYTPTVAPYDNAENERRQKARADEAAKGFADLSDEDKWELQAYKENNNNPVIPGYSGK